MAKLKATTGPSISLFPFLSILACLAGTVVMMIVALSMIQATQVGGRAAARNPAPGEFLELQDKLKAQNAKRESLTALIQKNESLQKELLEVSQRVIKLQMMLDGKGDSQNINRERQKELELLLIQLEELQKQKPAVAKQIEALKQELAARKLKADSFAPPVIVQPGGSGVARGKHLMIVEATGDAIIVHKSKTDKLRIAANTIGADKDYDGYLEKGAADKDTLVLFLLREDGWGSYLRGAGWAESQFKLATSKVPIPGKGPVDLTHFEKFMK